MEEFILTKKYGICPPGQPGKSPVRFTNAGEDVIINLFCRGFWRCYCGGAPDILHKIRTDGSL